jgi:DNA polymerase III sliding clamp (beta) subunit (PCNA family)
MKVKREELLKTLQAVDAGLSAKDIIEQSSCYVFKGGRVWTFNDDVACSAPLPKALKGFEFAIPAAELRSLLTKLDEDEVDVDAKGDDEKRELIVRSAKRRAGIRVHAEIVLPVSDVEVPEEWDELPKGFKETVETVQGCAGRDESMFVLTCVHVHAKGMEAMDNYQAIRCPLKMPNVKESVLVKRDDLKKAVGGDVEEWSIGGSWVHFRNSSGSVTSCRRWQEKYPELGPIFKVEGQTSPLPKSLVGAVEKAEMFVEEASTIYGVDVDLRPGKLLLRAEGPVGWYEERQKVEYEGEPLKFRISPKLLREICKRSDKCIVGEDKLKVKGDKFVYISCLVEDDE